jgi:hypothetical protein
MVLVEHPLGRLQGSMGQFIVPSAAARDVRVLRAQIELRRHALKDIEIIRSRLRLSLGCGLKRAQRRKTRSGSRSRSTKSLRDRLIARSS